MREQRVPILVVALWVLFATAPAEAFPIEAIRGKSYRLTPKHGPWMIQVASLYGKAAVPAADALIYELRRTGIPAYAFSNRGAKSLVQTRDRLGRKSRGRLTQQRAAVSVIAGNFSSVDSWAAQQTLKFVKRMSPKSITGGVYQKTRGRPNAFSGAFLIRNPLLPASANKAIDPIILHLNRGQPSTLLGNRGQYTLVVASYHGNSKVVRPGESNLKRSLLNFKVGNSLDLAASKARQLAAILRNRKYLSRLGRDNPRLVRLVSSGRLNAFVLHERYRSIVTVGEFNSPTDPGIKDLVDLFKAKQRSDPYTGLSTLSPEYILVPGRDSSRPPSEVLIFDFEPMLIPVPRTDAA